MAIGVILFKLVIDMVNDPGPDFFHFLSFFPECSL